MMRPRWNIVSLCWFVAFNAAWPGQAFVLLRSVISSSCPVLRNLLPLSAVTPLSKYNDIIDEKLAQADRVDTNTSVAEKLPVIEFVDLMHMAFAHATSDEMMQKRRDFAKKIQTAGGYCLVHLEGQEVTVIDEMWDCIDNIFQVRDQQNLDLRHQTLTREDSVEAHRNSGYKFVQTSLNDDSIPYLMDTVGKEASHQAFAAYQLLSVMAKAFTSVIYAGVTDSNPKDASDLVTRVLDDEKRPFNGAYHRLCRYVKADDGGQGWSESLRSHCDWTLATPIPVSSVSGLEIYIPTDQSWVRPELAARKIWENGAEEGDGKRWNSRFAVIMVGKWLELLTNEKVESTIHRVVSAKGAESRMSAPFFMRPKQQVFSELEQLVFDGSDKGTKAAYECIRDFLLKAYSPVCAS